MDWGDTYKKDYIPLATIAYKLYIEKTLELSRINLAVLSTMEGHHQDGPDMVCAMSVNLQPKFGQIIMLWGWKNLDRKLCYGVGKILNQILDC